MKLHEGMEIVASYHVVGMGADGVFMDTLDTVDVYPAEEFGEGMAKMVNELKAEYPGKEFIANRGFTILPQIIRSCAYVMFETFISEYDWNTGKYYELTDKDTVKENEEVKKKLRELRKAHTFDILALNYCADGAEGDALREKIAQTCYAEGYLSWSANIMLDNVLLPHHVKSDAWKGNVKPGNPFFSSMPAVEIACAVREQNNVKVWGEPIESTRLWRRYESVNRDEWYEIRWYEVKSFFAEEVTTMAWCFLLELKDGTRMGFTSCDIDLEIDGVIYEACAGFAPTAVATSNDMAVDNLDVEGTVSSERIDEADIYAGRYDNAKITIFICDYERPAMSFIMRRGTIGKLTSGKTLSRRRFADC